MTPLVSRFAAFLLAFAACRFAAAQEAVTVDARTTEIIAGSIKWLASQQESNGSWTGAKSGRAASR